MSLSIFGLILRIDAGQKIAAALINQIGHTQIPTLIAHKKMFKMTKAGRDLKAHTLDLESAITFSLSPPILDRKGKAQAIA